MGNANLTMVRGDTLAFGIEIEGLDTDLESAYFTAKDSYSAETPAFQKSLGDGITKVETGKYRVRVAPEDTRNVNPGQYYYDLQIGVNSDVYTIMKGTLDIENTVYLGAV